MSNSGAASGQHFGVGYAVSLTDLAGLRFEANYHEKGFAADFSLDGAAVQQRSRSDLLLVLRSAAK